MSNVPNTRKWWSTVKTVVFGASSNLPPLVEVEISWSGQQLRRPHCFRLTLTISSEEIAFTSRILVTLRGYCVLLRFGPALFVVYFCIYIIMVKLILRELFPFFKPVARELNFVSIMQKILFNSEATVACIFKFVINERPHIHL